MNTVDIFNKFMPFTSDEQCKQLVELGFFTSPASKKYHGNTPGGLFRHSLNVAEELILLTERNNLTWGRPESPKIIGMFHDLCKLDMYMQELSDDGTVTYVSNKDMLLPGHGDKSVILACQLGIKLTTEEMLCIRWHMGAFDEDKNWNYYTRSCKRFPNVSWTHQADMIASQMSD